MSRREASPIVFAALAFLVALGFLGFFQIKPTTPAVTPPVATPKPSPLHTALNQNPFTPAPVEIATAPQMQGKATTAPFNAKTQTFSLDQRTIAAVLARENAASPSPTNENPNDIEQRLMDFLVHSGVDFPSGSRIAYTPGLIYVTNTEENLAKIPNALLGALYDPPPTQSTTSGQ